MNSFNCVSCSKLVKYLESYTNSAICYDCNVHYDFYKKNLICIEYQIENDLEIKYLSIWPEANDTLVFFSSLTYKEPLIINYAITPPASKNALKVAKSLIKLHIFS